jgi:3-oxoacyl-[acyl-carrier protein] reductase
VDLGLKGRVALVTGASKGIGRAIAAELVSEGAEVAISSRSQHRIEATASEIGARRGYVLDSEDVDAATALTASVEGDLGPIDVLVTSTGGPPHSSDPFSFEREQWEAAYRSLVLSPMALIEAVLPAMRARGFGRIVNVSSSSVREPIPGLLLSTTHRAGMTGAFKTLADLVAADGVTLNTILPGRIATDRVYETAGSREQAESAARETIPAGRLGSPEELAAAAVFLCSERASYVTAASIAVDGGLTRSA